MDSLMFLDFAGGKMPLGVLLVEDNVAHGEQLAESLHQLPGGAIRLERVSKLADGLRMLAARRFDVLILDLSFPDSTNLDDIARVRGLFPAMPIVVLTGSSDGELAVQVLQNGAQDFVRRDNIDGPELFRTIRFAIERRRLEEANAHTLKIESATAKQILEYAPVGIARLSTTLAITEVNQVFADGFSFVGEELLGKDIHELLPELPAACIEHVMKTFSPCRIFSYEMKVDAFSKKPSEYWDIAVWPTKNLKQDMINGLVVIANNVTERVERTNQLEELTSAMVHDMKIPLIGTDRVLEAASSGQFGELPEKMENALLMLRRSNQKLLSMVSNLLYAHKEENVIERPYIAIHDFVELVAGCLKEMDPFFAEREIIASIKISDESNFVFCDSIGLRRVLLNLLHNACSHAKYGGGIVLSANLNDDGGLIIKVSDDGDGIEEAVLPTLFCRSWQKPGQVGGRNAGLGLYVARRIVEGCSGTIECTSIVGEGATFTVHLPNRK